MKFMTLVKSRENQGFPPQSLMQAIMKLGEDATKAGVLVEQGGLMPSAVGASIRLSGGKLHVTDGPYAEAKELVGGYAVYETKTKAEALEWCTRFMQIHLDNWKGWEGECEMRQIFEAPPSGML